MLQKAWGTDVSKESVAWGAVQQTPYLAERARNAGQRSASKEHNTGKGNFRQVSRVTSNGTKASTYKAGLNNL